MEWDFHDQFSVPELARLRCQECWGPYLPLPSVAVMVWVHRQRQQQPCLEPELQLGSPPLAEPTWGRLVQALTSLYPSLIALQRPEHHCGVKGMNWGDPLWPHRTPRLCLESPWAVTINEENCKLEHSVWAGHWAQNLGWVLKPRKWILPAAPSMHASLSIFIFLKFVFTLSSSHPWSQSHSLRRESLLWGSKPCPCLSQLINPARFDELLAQRKFLMCLRARRSKTQSKSSYPWHQDTLAKTILINYNYNCMLNKLWLGCLLYQPIILGM